MSGSGDGERDTRGGELRRARFLGRADDSWIFEGGILLVMVNSIYIEL
jgi:hypothetical protein